MSSARGASNLTGRLAVPSGVEKVTVATNARMTMRQSMMKGSYKGFATTWYCGYVITAGICGSGRKGSVRELRPSSVQPNIGERYFSVYFSKK